MSILDGEVITERRTAAASAVATKYLVNENPNILAILGSGVQARSHYAALSEIIKFDQVRVWNHRFDGAQRLATEIGEKCVACSSVQETVLDADVIVTVTSSKVPILKAEWVKPGAHINAVGACRPDWAEIDPELMRSAVVYADSYEGAERESGDVLLSQITPSVLQSPPIDHTRKISAQCTNFIALTRIPLSLSLHTDNSISAPVSSHRSHQENLSTVHKLRGSHCIALEDAVAAKLVLDKLGL